MDRITAFFNSDQFMPHGYCLMWRPDVFWLHVATDLVIALAYFSIPAALLVFALKRPKFRGRPIMLMFSAFVLACGVTHPLWRLGRCGTRTTPPKAWSRR